MSKKLIAISQSEYNEKIREKVKLGLTPEIAKVVISQDFIIKSVIIEYKIALKSGTYGSYGVAEFTKNTKAIKNINWSIDFFRWAASHSTELNDIADKLEEIQNAKLVGEA